MSISFNKASTKKGFTLIELAIAIAVIGIIVAMLFNKFGKSFITTAKAEAVYSNAKQVAESWKMLTNLCGTDLNPYNSTLSKAGASWDYNEWMLLDPEHTTYGIDKTKYRRCYAQSGFTGLSSILSHKSGCAWAGWGCLYLGEYNGIIQNDYNGGKNTMMVIVLLPPEIAEQVWLNYSGTTASSLNNTIANTSATMWTYPIGDHIAGLVRIAFIF